MELGFICYNITCCCVWAKIALMLRFGLLLSFFAVFLQVCVFLQTLLPQNYQISPVCETITLALLQDDHHTSLAGQDHLQQHTEHAFSTVQEPHQHDASHQCQYCTVYSNLVLPPDTGIREILVKVKIQLIWLEQLFERVYFALQRLFLLPQGRAPPLFV